MFCFHCGCIIHGNKGCGGNWCLLPVNGGKPFGHWLRVEEIGLEGGNGMAEYGQEKGNGEAAEEQVHGNE